MCVISVPLPEEQEFPSWTTHHSLHVITTARHQLIFLCICAGFIQPRLRAQVQPVSSCCGKEHPDWADQLFPARWHPIWSLRKAPSVWVRLAREEQACAGSLACHRNSGDGECRTSERMDGTFQSSRLSLSPGLLLLFCCDTVLAEPVSVKITRLKKHRNP